MFKLASLFVEITAQDEALQAQIGGIQRQLSAVGVAIGTAVGNLGAGAIASAASALTGFFTRGIVGASDLAETVSKVQAVFGQSADVVTGQAERMAKAYGLPKQAVLDASASIGLVAKSAGQSQAAAADLSAKMAKLAADASSFYNVPLDEALGKIRSGLVGEAEPLRAFGVLLSEEAVASEAVALGLAKSAQEVDNQAKVMARASLITNGLADASGDLERTQDSTANQWRKLTGSIENFAVAIGERLAPATNQVVGLFNDLAKAITGASESSGGNWIQSLADAAEMAVKRIRQEIRNFKDEAAIAALAATNAFGQNNQAIEQLTLDMLTREMQLHKEIADREIASAVAAAKKTNAQADALKIQQQQAAAAKVAADQAERDKRIADELGRKHKERMEAARKAARSKTAHEKEFSSQVLGVSDFALHLRSQIFGQNDVPKEQLNVLTKMLGKTSIIADELQKPRAEIAMVA